MAGSATPASPPAEPKRIRQLRAEIVKAIPKFPNDGATKNALMGMHLTQLLIHYGNWRLRFIRPAPRIVTVDRVVTSDVRYGQLQPAINALLAKARAGIELTPHLSLGAIKKGYTPAASAPRQPPPAPPVDRWADKDFLLNLMGFHHLHLGTTFEPEGHVKRTDEVLFVQVTRDTFEAVAILDHSVFDADPNAPMTAERSRLWDMFTQRTERSVPPGSSYIVSSLATSGHPIQLSRYCMRLARLIIDTDKGLDDPNYVADLYVRAGVPMPKKPKLSFFLNDLDFGLWEDSTSTFWNLHKGWI